MSKKVGKKDNSGKIKLWLILNFALILAVGIYIAVSSEVIGIADVVTRSSVNDTTYELTSDIVMESNKVMNRTIFIMVGIYSGIQLINYIMYLFKSKKVLYVLIALELIYAVYNIMNGVIMTVFPILSILIYLRLLKLEESK